MITSYIFDTEVAIEYGVNEAIMIKNFQFWIERNKANGRHFIDGHYWMYNSNKAFQELFPFWSAKTIRTTLDHLRERGVLIVGNHNQSSYDRTLWYAFADEEKWIGQKQKIELPKSANEDSEIGTPIPDILPDKLPDNNTPNKTTSSFISPNPVSEEILTLGEFKNVKLTKKEFYKLCETYQNYLPDAIESLSAYIATYGGKQYKGKTHYAIFNRNNWLWDKVHKNPDAGLDYKVNMLPDPTAPGGLRRQTFVEFYSEMYNVKA